MTKSQLVVCLLVVLSAVGVGAVPHAAASDETTTGDATTDAPSALDGQVSQSATPTLVSVRTTLNETQPTTDSNFTLTTHVENVADGDGDVLVESIEISRTPGGDDSLASDEPRKRLWSGSSLSNAQSLQLDDSGRHTLYVRVTLRHDDGEDYEVVQPVALTVYDPHPRMTVETESTLPGSRTSLNLSLTNGLDEPIRNVEIRLRGEEVSVKDDRRSIAKLDGTSTQTFAFEVSGETEGTANLTADLEYVTANGTHRTVTRTLTPTFTAVSNPGAVNLTGISVARRGQTLEITGSASNVGTTDVLGVTVGVESGTGVSPGQSTAEYFVGEVPASDFSSFKVQARLDGNASTVTIPLRVSYIVDDVRRNRTVSITYDVPQSDTEESSKSKSSFPLSVGLGAGLVGVVALAGGWRWFRGD